MEFYTVDVNYGNYLRSIDRRIPNFVYSGHDKFVVGVLLQINGHSYYAPVSHNTKPYQTSFMISDPRNPSHRLSSIRFAYMFPAESKYLKKLDFAAIRSIDPNYADLLEKEYLFCKANQTAIIAQACKVYRKATNPSDYFNKICCDFHKLEREYKNYP